MTGTPAELWLADDRGSLPSKEDLSSPRDYVGHDAHTLSTAGGSLARGAAAFGHGMGGAAGGAPRARMAAYKACYTAGCSDVDVLAAVLAAVADGVHVLSLSLGPNEASNYLSNPIAIGTFFAAQSGVAVVCSAGNSGPQPGTITNAAPWMFTVGVSTMDRDFPAYVTFGGGLTIEGQSLGAITLPLGQAYPIVSGENANAAYQPTSNSQLLDPQYYAISWRISVPSLSVLIDEAPRACLQVTGKIVVCVRGENDRVEKGHVVKEAGGIGMVLCNDAGSGDSVVADPHIVAAAHCSYSECVHLFNYLQSTENPSGYINATDASFGVKPAPAMADFSSRGPNVVTPQILKVSAHHSAPKPRTKYPTWSPAMIKSAIMTTATTVAKVGNPIQDETGAEFTPFSYGSCHVNPVNALDPGLVYDTTLADYNNFLCSLKLTQNPVQDLQGNLPVGLPINYSVPVNLLLRLFNAAGKPCAYSQVPNGRPEDMNYPSIAVTCLSGSTTVRRRLRNVGAPGESRVTVIEPVGVKVTVAPDMLGFGIDEEKEFTVKLDVVDADAASNYAFGSIVWLDANGLDAYGSGVGKAHRVWSPIVDKTKCG
ncbi:hypothetical protein C2845_PM10G03440 [Panicum miliaceum]|uniref:Subtilisin-like protease SBT5.3 n=1 Tax=Panicum miliaceum TaxID=4540 RepID=A0A3L6PBT0_PANMI|nr:hypothetical protein C2845_PM10G03440 [Panicum miliaceum]